MNKEEQQLIDFLDELLDSILEQVEEEQLKAVAKVLEYVKEFDVKDGIIQKEGSTSRIISGIKKELDSIFYSDEYRKLVNKITDSILSIEENSLQIAHQIGQIKVSGNFIKTVLSPTRILIEQQIKEQLLHTSLSANVTSPIIKQLTEAVQFGYSVGRTETVIKNEVRLSRHVGQIVRDGFFQWDGTIQQLVAERYDLDSFMYVGSTVKDSRGQCRKWAGKTLTLEEWEKEITWAKKGGSYQGHPKSGFIKGTNISNFAKYRGGHNCRHRLIAVNK